MATPEFPTTDSENDQITASNNSLKFKITKKPAEKAVYFVRFAMFEVAITKKPAVNAAKKFTFVTTASFRSHIK